MESLDLAAEFEVLLAKAQHTEAMQLPPNARTFISVSYRFSHKLRVNSKEVD